MKFLEGALSILGSTGENAQNLRELESSLDKLVPFVGAGLSVTFKYPGWKSFLLESAGTGPLVTSVENLLALELYEEAAEAVEQQLRERFNQKIESTFGPARIRRPVDQGAVRHLPGIARGPVLTTNFDPLLEFVFEDAGRRLEGPYGGSQIATANKAIQLRERVLLKLHGDYRSHYDRVLTLSEYERAYGAKDAGHIDWNLGLPRVLRQAIGSNPLLFLGCSLSTDRTTAIIAEVGKELPGIRHFALLSAAENTTKRCEQLDAWRFRPLFFPAGRFEKIEEFLAYLAEALKPQKSAAPKEVRQGYLTSFVGREDELRQLRDLLRAHRKLITITGPPGSGKTRIAVETIGNVRKEFADGIYFVPLDQIAQAKLVMAEIAGRLGIREGTGEEAGAPPKAAGSASVEANLGDFLSAREVLLVLDNFEHVVEAAPEIARLAAACSKLTILITSRERLRVQGESEVALRPLSLPDEDRLQDLVSIRENPAVELFAARAKAASPGFTVTAANARTVAAICRKLDGLPLTIELAASKLHWYSVESLLERLEDRLTFLARGSRELPEIRDAIAWSYQLLDTAEQTVFRRVSVFGGGFDCAAAEAIIALPEAGHAILEQWLESLADKSLLQVEPGRGEPRYHMLGVIQDFARELLDPVSYFATSGTPLPQTAPNSTTETAGEVDALTLRFAEYFAETAERHLLPMIFSPEEAPQHWLGREIGNLRTALQFAVKRDLSDLGLRLAVAMKPYWLDLGHVTEGREWLGRFLALAGPDEPFVIEPDETESQNWWNSILRSVGLRRNQEVAEPIVLGFPNPLRTQAVELAAMLAAAQHDYESSKQYLEELRVTGEKFGDRRLVESATLPLGVMPAKTGDFEKINAELEKLQREHRELGNEIAEANVLLAMGNAALRTEHRAVAKTHLENARQIFDRLGNMMGLANVHAMLAEIASMDGDRDKTMALLTKALSVARNSYNPEAIALLLVKSGHVRSARSELRTARGHFEEALKLGETCGNVWITLSAASGLGRLSLRSGRLKEARSHLERAEGIARELGSESWIAETILGLAGVAVAEGRLPERLGEAIALCRKLGRKDREAAGLITIAEGEWIMSRYDEAIKTFGEARKVFDSIGDSRGVANTVTRIGHAYRDRGDYEQAEQHYGEALALYRQTQSDAAVANCIRLIADLYRRQRRFDDAKKKYEEALAFCRETKEAAGEANTLMALGELYAELRE